MTTSPSLSTSFRMLPALMSEPEPQPTASAASADSSKTTASTTGQSTGDFYQQLLTVLALSLAMPGGSSSSGLPGMSSGAGQSSGMGSNFMAPVLLTLIEKLLASQVEQAKPQTTTIQAGPATGVGSKSDSEAFGDDVPAGMPVHGYMTQASHSGHVAIDWGIPVGTDVKSTMNGKVIYAGWNNEGYGNLVIVQNGPYKTYYAHLSKIPVRVGESVKAGEVIGKSGNTGNSTGPHLHYEVRLNNQQQNPAKFLGKRRRD